MLLSQKCAMTSIARTSSEHASAVACLEAQLKSHEVEG